MIAHGTGHGVSFGGVPGDTTPGGSSDVWLWETGICMQWETGIFILTE